MVPNRTPILIVDDDDGNLKALKRCLEKDYPTVLSSDPRDALNKIKKETFSVVICDLKMPHLTGIEFLKMAGALQPTTTRILLTAYSDPKEILEAINYAEIYRYLTKPWEVPELIAAVKQGYERFELTSQNHALLEKLKKMNMGLKELEALAMTDELTSILNRRAIFLKMEEEKMRADRFQRPFCIAMVDLDNFKKYNDEHGHVEGDTALKKVAQCLASSLRKIDSVGRYGGEEFLIVLPETKLALGKDICDRLRATIEKTCPVKVSIGVSSYPGQAKTTEEIVLSADKALYEAKHQGKNRVVAL